MKTKPIIFSSPMINALREGRKTQTRRIIKPQPLPDMAYTGFVIDGSKEDIGKCRWADKIPVASKTVYAKLPYKVGDLLWVKEGYFLQKNYNALPSSQCQGSLVMYAAGNGANVYGKKRSPLFMPRWASRLTLEITSVRVERLQDISHSNARAEGCEGLGDEYYKAISFPAHCSLPVKQYKALWESINGKGSWRANPWVWCITFIVHNKNIDDLINKGE